VDERCDSNGGLNNRAATTTSLACVVVQCLDALAHDAEVRGVWLERCENRSVGFDPQLGLVSEAPDLLGHVRQEVVRFGIRIPARHANNVVIGQRGQLRRDVGGGTVMHNKVDRCVDLVNKHNEMQRG